jgi:hypothetical protein
MMELDCNAGVSKATKDDQGAHSMPVILWLLGVPLTVVVLLMLFGVV